MSARIRAQRPERRLDVEAAHLARDVRIHAGRALLEIVQLGGAVDEHLRELAAQLRNVRAW